MCKKYYINLDRSVERKQFMKNSYNNITRISAYDGKQLVQYDDIILPKTCEQNNYQLACSFSHIKAIVHSYTNGDEEALILEDDVSNEYAYKWDKNIETIILNCPIDCECISLFCSKVQSVKKMIAMDNDYCEWDCSKWSTCCYYINRKGMKKIYDLFYKNGKIDLSIKLCNYVADDGVIYKNLTTYNYTKPLFINKMFSSTISNYPVSEKIINDCITNYFLNK